MQNLFGRFAVVLHVSGHHYNRKWELVRFFKTRNVFNENEYIHLQVLAARAAKRLSSPAKVADATTLASRCALSPGFTPPP